MLGYILCLMMFTAALFLKTGTLCYIFAVGGVFVAVTASLAEVCESYFKVLEKTASVDGLEKILEDLKKMREDAKNE